jgi:hypothetical protein
MSDRYSGRRTVLLFVAGPYNVQPIDAPEEKLPFIRAKDSPCVEFISLQAVSDIIDLYAAPSEIDLGKPGICADPEISVSVLGNGINSLVRKALFISISFSVVPAG